MQRRTFLKGMIGALAGVVVLPYLPAEVIQTAKAEETNFISGERISAGDLVVLKDNKIFRAATNGTYPIGVALGASPAYKPVQVAFQGIHEVNVNVLP